ncbi:MAG: hypothetical protein ACK44D_11990 [Bacteroidia bacterium]
MQSFNLKGWLKLSLISLLTVGLLGVLMRYKICYELPFIDQKHTQHAHSHFAFAGWVTQTLMVFITSFLVNNHFSIQLKKYQTLLYLNLITAYGMLVSFLFQGYGAVSITCSTLSILISFVFAFFFWVDTHKTTVQTLAVKWFKAALFFMVISSIGTFMLAYMMVTKQLEQHLYLASVYWYLHFQYNGWFFFACMGLLFSEVKISITHSGNMNLVFWFFAISCVPAYMLSTLWAKLPLWLYGITVVASIGQSYAWVKFLLVIKSYYAQLVEKSGKLIGYVIIVLALALSAKFLLQLGSTIPEVSEMAFGFRAVVIAYLHLILLAIISLFLIVFMHIKGLLSTQNKGVLATLIFTATVYANELVLGIQGVTSIVYVVVPFSQQALLYISVGIVLSVVFLFKSMLASK